MKEQFDENQRAINTAIAFLNSTTCPSCKKKPKFLFTELTVCSGPVINFDSCGCKQGDEYFADELAKIIPQRFF